LIKVKLSFVLLVGAAILACVASRACELCAINNATSARAEATGFVFSLGEQFISSHTPQYRSQPLPQQPHTFINDQYLDTSVTHLIPGFNFNRDLGVSLNVPIVRKEYRYYRFGDLDNRAGKGEGLGDLALVLRWTPWSIQKMTHSARFNLFGGLKMPTGDTRRLREDVQQEAFFDQVFGVGHDHAFSAVHLHDLTLGSGSYDGIFGATANARWKKFFATAEGQYYLRTHGEGDFKFGDTLMLSGGPGVYAFVDSAFTFGMQAALRYENTERSLYGSKPSAQTGMREIYGGPEIFLTAGPHFSAKFGGDIPVDIRNSGLQIVPDWRLHASLTWSF
jgi:hypothetical protein